MDEQTHIESLRTTVLGERTVYDSPWIRLSLVEIEPPNTKRFEHHVVHLRPVAIAVLLNDRGEVLMLWRHRFATDSWGYEFLGGLVEPGESPQEAAARESVEESGWKPIGDAEHLASFQLLPGMIDSPIDIFLWPGAEQVGSPTDEEEAGKVRWVPISELSKLLTTGQLLGASTVVGALHLLLRRLQK